MLLNNKKYEANHFLKMFPDRGQSFNELKHLTEKTIAVALLSRVWVVVEHTHPTAKINKVKDGALIFLSVSLPHHDFIYCHKHHEQAFLRNFFHSHSFNAMFIVSGNLIAVTTFLLSPGLHRCQQRIFKKNTNYFYPVRISILLAILSEMFIQIDYFF